MKNKIKNRKFELIKENIKNYSNISSEVHQVLLGSLLGDMYLRRENKTPNIEETHSIDQKDYLSWKNNIVSKFFDLRLYHIKGSTTSKARGKEFIRKPQVRLRSKVSNKLIYYHNLFYKNNKKRISSTLLNQIDTLALAVWYCDDGYFDPQNLQAQIHTEGYSIKENQVLKDWFSKKWNLNANFKKEPWKKNILLRFPVKETDRFLNLIKDHIFEMPKCMWYKLGYLWEGNILLVEKVKLKKKRRMKLYQTREDVKARKREQAKVYYYKNHEKSLKRALEYYTRNKEKIKAYMKRPEVRKRANERSKEKWRDDAEYREKQTLYQKEYRKRPEYKERIKEYRRRALIKRKRGDRN